MKTFKHLFTALLLLFATVATAHNFEVGGIYYNITDATNKTVAVTYRGYYSNSYSDEYTGSVTIPESVTYSGTTYSVTSIGESAFKDCYGLTSIEIGNSVTSIGNYAFSGCKGLTSIVIGNGVTSIGSYAFYGCTGLTSITIPNSVTSIGYEAFYRCTGLTSITIPNSVTSIGGSAFEYCSGLTSIVIGNGVTSIGSYAFEGCTGLTSITIPNSVTSIESYAFYSCSGLKTVINFSNITFSKGSSSNGYIAYYADKVLNVPNGFIDGDFVWFENEDGMTLAGYLGDATELILSADYKGKSVTSIGYEAFSGCTGLTSITIPNSVTSIGYKAFSGCTGLTSITIPNSVTSIGERAFEYCSGLASIVIGNGVTSIGDWAFYNCSRLTSIEIPNSVTGIGSYAFSGCSGLTSVEFNAVNCISMGNSSYPVFGNCTALSTVIIGENVKTIPSYAFYGCSGLTSIVIGNSVTSIGSSAFSGCSGLKKAIWLTNTPPSGYNNINATYNYVANNQYSGLNNIKVYPYLSSMFEVDGVKYVPVSPAERTCDAIDCAYNDTIAVDVVIGKTVSFKGIAMNVKEIMPYTLYANKKIKSVKVENEGYIGNYAFSGCTALTTATVSNKGNIGIYAFSGCTALITANVLNEGYIGNYAFSGCTALTTATVSNKGNIGIYAFSGCTALITANVLNEGNIGDYAFKDSFKANDSIAKVIISNKGSIGQGAFSGCTALTSADVSNKGNIGSYAFNGCSYLIEATFGDSVTSIGQSAFSGCSSLKEIEIPDNVTTVGSNALYGCSSLKSAKIGAGVTAINEATFSGCSAMTSITVGNNVKTIGKNALNGCSSLAEITIPQSVTQINDYAFYNCSSLKDVIIEDAETALSLGSNGSSPLFADCPLDSMYIGRKITYNTSSSYGYSPFYRNTSLKTVVITDTETEIYDNEFYGCSNLKNVSIGNGVNKIGNWAFSGCSSLDYFAFGKNVRSIGEEAFSDCNNVSQIISRAKIAPACGAQALDDINKWSCTLWVPENYKSEYQAAEQWKEFFFIEGIAAEMYTVTFVVDGEIYDTVSVEYDEVIALPETPTKEGHTFSGWSEMPETMPAEDITIEGTFTINHYTVTYVVDGEVYATDSIAYGNEIILIDEPTKEGHTFSGWSEAPATMPAEDITIEGTFTVNHYTVTYVVDGEVYATETIAYGSEITLIDEPTKEGHTFSGWSEAPATMPAEDVVIEGSFAVNYYTVTYMVDGEVYATETVAYGSEITLIDEPTKEGHTFSGWSEAPATMPAEDIVIEGTFTVNYYTVTYIVDGEVYATETVAYGSEITLIDEPTKEGHTFSGWSEAPATMPAEDVVIEGSFAVNYYTVTYMVDGEVYATETVAYGSEITLIDEPTKEGYTFSGWSEAPETMPDNDITVEGYFIIDTAINDVEDKTINVQNVYYDLNGRAIVNPTNGVYILNGKKVLVK